MVPSFETVHHAEQDAPEARMLHEKPGARRARRAMTRDTPKTPQNGPAFGFVGPVVLG